MTTKNKRLQRAAAQSQSNSSNGPPFGMITPPKEVAGVILHRTVESDITFGRCVTALQLLPNGALLFLVTEDQKASTFILGEEAHGFTEEEAMIQTDGTSEP